MQIVKKTVENWLCGYLSKQGGNVQAEYRYLPAELLSYVAKQIGITETKAYSVATFYENFSFEAKGKAVIKVCDGTACHVRHSTPVLEVL